MGSFNSLDVTITCPSCQVITPREVQFRYGAVWQYRYHLGDVLRWGRNDVGDPAAPDVVVDAWLCECPSCDHDGRIAVYVRHNILATVGSVDDAPLLAELEWRPLARKGGDEAAPTFGSTAKRLAEQRVTSRIKPYGSLVLYPTEMAEFVEDPERIKASLAQSNHAVIDALIALARRCAAEPESELRLDGD